MHQKCIFIKSSIKQDTPRASWRSISSLPMVGIDRSIFTDSIWTSCEINLVCFFIVEQSEQALSNLSTPPLSTMVKMQRQTTSNDTGSATGVIRIETRPPLHRIALNHTSSLYQLAASPFSSVSSAGLGLVAALGPAFRRSHHSTQTMSARQLFVLMCKVLNIEERIYIGKPKLERNQLAAINAMLVDNLGRNPFTTCIRHNTNQLLLSSNSTITDRSNFYLLFSFFLFSLEKYTLRFQLLRLCCPYWQRLRSCSSIDAYACILTESLAARRTPRVSRAARESAAGARSRPFWTSGAPCASRGRASGRAARPSSRTPRPWRRAPDRSWRSLATRTASGCACRRSARSGDTAPSWTARRRSGRERRPVAAVAIVDGCWSWICC